MSETKATKPTKPPKARIQPIERKKHGDTRLDPFHWLRNRESTAVTKHLTLENSYCSTLMQPLQGLQSEIFAHLRSHVIENDQSVPYRWHDHDYYYRWQGNLEHQIYYRKPADGGTEQILLDLNRLAADDGFIEIGCFELSPNGRLLAYGLDLDGDERHTISILDMDSGRVVGESRPGAAGDVAWFADNDHFLYVTLDDSFRPLAVWQGRVSQPASQDKLIYSEADPGMFLSVDASRSGDFVFIGGASNDMSETRVWSSREPDGQPLIIQTRQKGVEYFVDHQGEHFYMLTNSDGAKDFSVKRAPTAQISSGQGEWQLFLAHRPGRMVEGLDCFADFIVVSIRENLRQSLHFYRPSGEPIRVLDFPPDAYEISDAHNPTYEAKNYRFEYSSPVDPTITYDYQPVLHNLKIVKETKIPHYQPNEFSSQKIMAIAPDGAEIPMVITGHRDTWAAASPAPCYLSVYGAYGVCLPNGFSRDQIVLLQHGFLVATAHIRGGADLGRGWYEAGKGEHKENTFRDVIACAERLIELELTSAERLILSGGSAGGMTVAVAVNRRPELFGSIAAHVPFVDVLTTMLDDSLPLTALEYSEWGNPNERAAYLTIRGYSPYDNVVKQDYPPIYVTAGLNDQRVTYWEPAKWVARLRHHNTSPCPIVLRINMDAGHQGASGRFAYLHELAEEFAFHWHQLGLPPPDRAAATDRAILA